VLLVLQQLYPDVVLTNVHPRIYKQEHSLVATRIATGLGFKPLVDRDELRAKRQKKQQDIRDNGVKYLGMQDFGSERAALIHVKMGGGKTTMIRGILRKGKRSLILTHRQTLAADIYSEVHRKLEWHEQAELDDPLDFYTRPELKHYNRDFPSKALKSTMGAANQLICQLESIGHLQGCEPYEYVMIDESQLFFCPGGLRLHRQDQGK